jgi:nucleoside-diphosphate-sugar epimerase
MTFALRGQTYTINGDGTQSRDFTYVANAVQANMLAATALGVNGAVINIACGRRISLNDLTAILNRLVGRDIPTVYGAARTGDVEHSLADISEARARLGYEPLVDVETGLARTLDWYREHEA